MRRLACIDLPALPLQLLLRDHPDWRDLPVAVVAAEKPQAGVLWANRPARVEGVNPGMRYAAALSLAPGLRAGVVPEARVDSTVAALMQSLQAVAPYVQAVPGHSGAFWVDGRGLTRLYRSPAAWARDLRAAVVEQGYTANVAVGFTAFGTWALARTIRQVRVLASAEAERDAVDRIPLARLELDPTLLEGLSPLAVHTLGDFVRLPAQGLLERFGEFALRLHRLAGYRLDPVLDPAPLREPARQSIVLEDPESETSHLLFLIKSRLPALLNALEFRGQALKELELRLKLDGQPEDADARPERIRPAAPTLDARQVLDLVRLRLEALHLAAPVVGLELSAHGTEAAPEQRRLFNEVARRDLTAGNQALARIRSEFGENAVVKASLREGHLPEAQFAWEPVREISPPRDPGAGPLRLVRRLYTQPLPLSELPGESPVGSPAVPPAPETLLQGPVDLPLKPIVRCDGPHRVSGGWWAREAKRDYYFVETSRGSLSWIYYDAVRGRWFLHGRVE